VVGDSENSLGRGLVGRVLERLEIPANPAVDLATLEAVFAAWCQRIPFDNVRKIIHVQSGDSSPLPGGEAAEFFESWLDHGTGGTCWTGSGALHALLSAMGFEAERALGTMLVAPDLPPNHGSVRVRLGDSWLLLDSSVLHHQPLLLAEDGESRIEHPAWGVRCAKRDGRWHLKWRPLHKPEGFECRFESFGNRHGDYLARYDQTRGWSPFNYQVCARRLCGDEVIGLAFGHFITLKADGRVSSIAIDDRQRVRVLTEEFGMSREIIGRLPPDRPTPPAPGSRTAAAAEV
jgi:N-hydroxyarylamine O-acetyltransferase